MFRKLVAAAVAVAAVWPVAAQAANHGFYASVDAGAVSQSLNGPLTAISVPGVSDPAGGVFGLGTTPPAGTNGAGIGSGLFDKSPDLGWAVFGEAGMRLNGPFRVEGEFGYRKSTFSSVGDIDHLTVMANLLYDFAISDRFSLSIGGGIGADRISWTGDFPPWGNGSDDVWKFAVQGIAGASFKITPHASIDLKYRYLVPTSVLSCPISS